MMNDAERGKYREKMRNARSAEERRTLRDEHRKLMETRAREQGVTLPDARGPGPGPGSELRTRGRTGTLITTAPRGHAAQAETAGVPLP